MPGFDEWAADLADSVRGTQINIPEELESYMDGNGIYWYPWKSCGSDMEIEDPEAFDPDMAYCGGSDRCIP